ncbi:hypothetical protein [Mycolicibacterium sp.]|uniref:hypothetical protein n=1 Tax=Mycolicibacterium sp. TaxID=2320850 RepID=UPI0037C9ACF8
MKGKVVELVGALIGLCVIGWGIVTMSTAGESCGSHSMSDGDRCTTITGNHSSSTRSQDEQASKDQRTGLFQIGIGVLITGACVWSLLPGKKSSSEPPTQAPYPPQQWPPANPPGY